jgi:hypothetical protein
LNAINTPNSNWAIKKIVNLTTMNREYRYQGKFTSFISFLNARALVAIESLPLLKEILTPSKNASFPSPTAVASSSLTNGLQKVYNVSQLEAINKVMFMPHCACLTN